ncbi:MAG TPA: metallopeptidase TldD-related protein [Terriglobales bacterium]|nr:metallopeptidase TldD-related protein [Terriglobales bacterium]
MTRYTAIRYTTTAVLFSAMSSAMLLCGLSTSARAANSASGDVVLRALREEMGRSKANLKLEKVPAPYYIEYRVTEIDQFEASAVFGALRNQQHNRGRLLRVVVRVGDYKQDSFFGTGEGTIDLVPSDDDVFAIRHRLWLATDRAYKAATEALSAKQAALKQLKVDEPVDDFAKTSPLEAVEPLARFSSTDFTSWIHLLEEASAQYRTDKELENFESALRFTVENRYFLNSEGTVARSGHARYVISIAGSTQASDGMLLQRSHADQGNDLKDLPTREEFLKTTARILDTLKLLRAAPVVDEEYRGPVLFSNDAAATVVTELVEPNVLGRKPQLGENARTTGKWSSSYKARVLPDFINVFDDPTISTISGQPLFGNYTLDDEGVKAQRVSLVEKGQLVSYLIGRQPIRDFPASNGHGRAAATAAPAPHPGNLVLQSTDPQPDAGLKTKLIDLCRNRELPYGLYVETMGPKLEPRLLYRIWTKDAHEELVRGGVFGDLDVRSLRSDLIAAGTAPAVEDRPEPVWFSVASPALLFDELQVKRTQAAKQKLPEYPAPALGAATNKP